VAVSAGHTVDAAVGRCGRGRVPPHEAAHRVSGAT